MNIRLKVTAIAFCASLAAVALFNAQPVPVSQIDVFANNDVRPALARLSVEETVAVALASMSPAERFALVPHRSGAALAGTAIAGNAGAGDPRAANQIAPIDLADAVSVEAIAADHLRIRVYAYDSVAGQTMARLLHSELAGAGLDERVRLESRSSGGQSVLVARGVVVVLVLFGLALGMTLLANALRRQQRTARPGFMDAASI